MGIAALILQVLQAFAKRIPHRGSQNKKPLSGLLEIDPLASFGIDLALKVLNPIVLGPRLNMPTDITASAVPSRHGLEKTTPTTSILVPTRRSSRERKSTAGVDGRK